MKADIKCTSFTNPSDQKKQKNLTHTQKHNRNGSNGIIGDTYCNVKRYT